MFKYIIALTLFYSSTNNLLCNGDFQTYSTTLTYLQEPYGYQISDFQCWYQKYGGLWKVKRKSFLNGSLSAQLMKHHLYTLCQKVSLTLNQTYTLRFEFITPQSHIMMGTYVGVNGVIFANVSCNIAATIKVVQTNFVATLQNNTICFIPYGEFGLFDDEGPSIDNVSLIVNQNPDNISINQTIIAENQSFVINYTSSNVTQKYDLIIDFQVEVDQLQGIIYLYGKYQAPSHITNEVSQFLKVNNRIHQLLISDQLQEQTQTLPSSNQYRIDIKVYPSRSYQLNQLYLVLPQLPLQAQQLQINYIISINGRKINFLLLSQAEIELVQNFQPISQRIAQLIKNSHIYLKGVFCSYLLINILSFCNIILLFNFLSIASRPAFATNFLEMLALIFYKLNTFLQFITDIFNLKEMTLDFSNQKIQENMEQFRNNRAWFGQMGLSTNFLSNNFETLLTIVLLILKIGFIKILVKFLPTKITLAFSLQVKSPLATIASQFIPVAPFIIISAFSSIQSLSMNTYNEKFNNLPQILMICIFLNAIAIAHIINTSNNKVKKRKKEKNDERNYEGAENLLYIGLPVLILVGNNEVFMAYCTIVTIYRIKCFIRQFKTLSVGKKVYGLCINMVWVINILIYLFLVLMDHLLIDIPLSNKLSQTLKISGIGIICCFLIGGAIEIIYFIANILHSVVMCFKRIGRICRKSPNSIKPAENIENKNKNEKECNENERKIAVENIGQKMEQTIKKDPVLKNIKKCKGERRKQKNQQAKKDKNRNKPKKQQKNTKKKGNDISEQLAEKIKRLPLNQAIIIERIPQ